MDLNKKNDECQTEQYRESNNLIRVICSNSKEHARVSNLCKMGLSLQAIAAITGLPEKDLKRFQ